MGAATYLVLANHCLNRRVITAFLASYDLPCDYGNTHPPSIMADAVRKMRFGWYLYAANICVCLWLAF